jgi:hypothetical protein
MFIDALTTDFDFNIVDQVVTDPVEPSELGTRTISGLELYLRQSGLEVHAVDQITVTLDGTGDLLTEVRSTIEGIFNGLHSEVSVSAIDNLKNKIIPFLSEYFEAVIPQKLHLTHF